jgi:DNA-binding response OmpR family regulator
LKALDVLIIDDDERLNGLLTEYLGRFGFSVRAASHPDEGLRAFETNAPDLLVLDVMLPGTDGFTVCRRVRQRSQVPIVMLTARGDVTDRITGLEMGADDYLAKPFEPRELVARMQAVLRRREPGAQEERRFGALTIGFSTRTASLRGDALDLTTAEFDLLAVLARSPRRVLSRDHLIEAMHGIGHDAYDRSVDVLISRLRQKLGDDSRRAKFIRTVRGVGYSLAAGGSD